MRTQLGHYDIVSELGRGGMGVVYKGFEGSLNRYVAIKVLADSLAHDEDVKERFLREARSMAALNDPHIIQVYFIGDDEGQTYMVMEFVEGESLGSMLKRDHRLTVEQAAKVIHQTAMGLATAHDRGVVHRDIKPGNLMINSRGAVKIADFGIALSNQDFSKKLTSTGEFVGTPGYLSPEVCLGKPVDQRSDIFSLGIVLFEMLTGKMPFNDESPLGLMLEVVRAEIPDVRGLNSDVDPDIARILTKMIAKDPTYRYQNCHELVVDLGQHPLVAKGGPITVQPRLSTAASTLIGQKTPVSGQASLPKTPVTPSSLRTPAQANTRITPSAQPLPPPAPSASSGHRSVLDRNDAKNSRERSSALPWAIAALVLLGAGGGAWAFRGHIPTLSNLLGQPAAVAQNGNVATPTPLSGAHDVVASVAPGNGATPPSLDNETRAPATAENAVAAAEVETLDSTTPNETGTHSATTSDRDAIATASTPANSAATDSTTDVAMPVADAVASSSAGDGAAATSSAHAGSEAAGDPPATKATNQVKESPPLRVATVSAPERTIAPPKPRVPTIAVVAAGDDVISAPAQDSVIELLQSRGFRVIEGGHSRSGQPNLSALAGKADAVVMINARAVGTQEMQYYGQSSTLYTVQLGVKAYRTSDRSVLWTGNGEQVNFTTLNAAEKAREAIAPMLDQIDSRLGEFRARGKRG